MLESAENTARFVSISRIPVGEKVKGDKSGMGWYEVGTAEGTDR
jgi:hypothetical protein